MKTLRLLVVPIAAGALLAACADDNGTSGPDEDPLDPFVGTWNAVEFSYSAGEASLDLTSILGANVFSVTVESDGSFTGEIRLPDPQAGVVTIPVAGMIELQDNDMVQIDFDAQTEQSAPFGDFTASYEFEGDDRLVWVNDQTSFDVDQDGTEETATLRVVLERQ